MNTITNVLCSFWFSFLVHLPMWVSISTIFSMLLGSIRGEVILFSTARHTPSVVWIPMAVEPNWKSSGVWVSDGPCVYKWQSTTPHRGGRSCGSWYLLWWPQWHIPPGTIFLQERMCSHLCKTATDYMYYWFIIPTLHNNVTRQKHKCRWHCVIL